MSHFYNDIEKIKTPEPPAPPAPPASTVTVDDLNDLKNAFIEQVKAETEKLRKEIFEKYDAAPADDSAVNNDVTDDNINKEKEGE